MMFNSRRFLTIVVGCGLLFIPASSLLARQNNGAAASDGRTQAQASKTARIRTPTLSTGPFQTRNDTSSKKNCGRS